MTTIDMEDAEFLIGIKKRVMTLEQQVSNQAVEINKLKIRHPIDRPDLYSPLRWKEASVRAEADQLPPRRSDVAAIFAMKAFIERFLAYDDLGQCVPAVIRDDAREALGRARVESSL